MLWRWFIIIYTAKNAREINGTFSRTTAYASVYASVTGPFRQHVLNRVYPTSWNGSSVHGHVHVVDPGPLYVRDTGTFWLQVLNKLWANVLKQLVAFTGTYDPLSHPRHGHVQATGFIHGVPNVLALVVCLRACNQSFLHQRHGNVQTTGFIQSV